MILIVSSVRQTLPVHIDVGTNTQSIIADPFYQGIRQPRDRSVAYDELIAEFFDAAQEAYGRNVLIQVKTALMVMMRMTLLTPHVRFKYLSV